MSVANHLVLSIHLHDRFHGMAFRAPEWPPSPARVFQALVAGVARGRSMPEDAVRALEWLERLEAPWIGAPRSRAGERGALWVPNNDLDAKGGDPAKVADLRTAKIVMPRLMEGSEPLLYGWSWADEERLAETVARAAEQVYQLGRGVDLAWAHGEILDDEGVDRLLTRYPGVVYEPAGRGDASGSLCPMSGSLGSLRRRFEARRLHEVIENGKRRELFENAPKPLFRSIRYGRRTELACYDLLDGADDRRSFPVSLDRVASLVEAVRDGAAARLREAFPEQAGEIERIVVGRKLDGSDEGPVEDRVRIIPLPSVGHPHADLGVRRLVIALPGGSALSTEDLAWAFDELAPAGAAAYLLARVDAGPMVERYVCPARQFRTVTPVVLPQAAARRRIDPTRRASEGKGGRERDAEEQRAYAAVRTALRHAGIRAAVEELTLRREPFDRRGSRAEPFAAGTRFAKERLWHVSMTFDREVAGPLVIGDGRFLGLGVMAPIDRSSGIYAFVVEDGIAARATPEEVSRALRRAVMSRVQGSIGRGKPLPAYFSGHDGRHGVPAQDGTSPHLSFAFDPIGRRLLVVAPHVLVSRVPDTKERGYLALLDEALEGFHQLRAARAGLLSVQRVPFEAGSDPLTRAARAWRTISSYRINRHAKKIGAREALAADVRLECSRRNLPDPRVTVRAVSGVPGVGLVGEVELEFSHAVTGPILLGRNRHVGGGLFVAANERREQA